MMGTQEHPARLFHDFRLDDHVPEDHMLRRIDHFPDLGCGRTEVMPFCSTTGRPLIDPAPMIRMRVVGGCMGIRSGRRLCGKVLLSLACRRFCRPGLDGRVPDHSTFPRNRHSRFRGSDNRYACPGGKPPNMAANDNEIAPKRGSSKAGSSKHGPPVAWTVD